MNPDIVSVYRDHPMHDGDVVLLIEALHVATEIEGLADHWDQVLCRNVATVLRELGAPELQIGIARAHEVLQARDHQLLGDLREELAGSGIVVRELLVLPADVADAA
jgi:hypothetical protein